MENAAAAIAVLALVFVGVELASPGKILRIAEPKDWKALAVAIMLCGGATILGVLGMLRGEGFIVPTVWPPPAAEDTTVPGPQQQQQQQQSAPKDQPPQADQPAQPDQAQGDWYTLVRLDDLKLDRKRMIGRRIEVHGAYSTLADLSLLSAGAGDGTPIFLDIAQLPDEDRRTLAQCHGCGIDVKGVVGPVRTDIGVRVTSIMLDR